MKHKPNKEERLKKAKTKFPEEYKEWEQANAELEKVQRKINKRDQNFKENKDKKGRILITIFLLELAMEVTDRESLKPIFDLFK